MTAPEARPAPTADARVGPGHVLGVAIAVVPLIAIFNPKGVAPLFAVTAIVALALHLKAHRRFPRLPMPVSLAVLALGLWAAASMLWHVAPSVGRTIALTLPLTLFAGCVLIGAVREIDERQREFLRGAAVVGAVLGAGLALVELGGQFPFSRLYMLVVKDRLAGWDARIPNWEINNGAVAVALFLWPALAVLWSRGARVRAVILYLMAAAVAVGSGSLAAAVSVAAGAAAALVAALPGKWGRVVLGAGILVIVFGAPAIMSTFPDGRSFARDHPGLPYSVYPRVMIWQFVTERIWQAPVLGHGVKSSRALGDNRPRLDFFIGSDPRTRIPANTQPVPLHPHNGVLQVWLELGGVGAAIGAALLLGILGAIFRRRPRDGLFHAANAALIGGLCIACVAFGLWQGWWQGTLWLLAAVFAGLWGPRGTPAGD